MVRQARPLSRGLLAGPRSGTRRQPQPMLGRGSRTRISPMVNPLPLQRLSLQPIRVSFQCNDSRSLRLRRSQHRPRHRLRLLRLRLEPARSRSLGRLSLAPQVTSRSMEPRSRPERPHSTTQVYQRARHTATGFELGTQQASDRGLATNLLRRLSLCQPALRQGLRRRSEVRPRSRSPGLLWPARRPTSRSMARSRRE